MYRRGLAIVNMKHKLEAYCVFQGNCKLGLQKNLYMLHSQCHPWAL